jgi:septum site-determining protein MinC
VTVHQGVSSDEGVQRLLAKERAHETSEKVPLPVQVKADRNGFTLVPDPAASLDAIVAFMDERLEQSHDFFQKTEMVLDLRTRPMRTDEISVLYEKLYEKSKVKVVEVRLSDELSFSIVAERRKSRIVSKGAGPEPENCAPLIVRNTCRSGVRIDSPSDCVVLGDVNPGAEIIAEGDVVVFGTLRGLAHAGAAFRRMAARLNGEKNLPLDGDGSHGFFGRMKRLIWN